MRRLEELDFRFRPPLTAQATFLLWAARIE